MLRNVDCKLERRLVKNWFVADNLQKVSSLYQFLFKYFPMKLQNVVIAMTSLEYFMCDISYFICFGCAHVIF